MLRRLAIPALMILATVAIVVANNKPAAPQPQPGQVFVVETVTKKGPGKAHDFTWRDGGRTQSYAQYTSGKVVLLNIWATWCGPCKREIPDLIEIATELAPKGVVVVGVSVDEDDRKLKLVKNYVEKAQINYLNIIDNTAHEIAAAYGGITSIPTTFIIDRNGNIVEKIVGMRSKAVFMSSLARAM
jgi:thiol-disulfide isomerase/thioredoxin